MGDLPRIAVNEIFGVTFQGEGLNIGVPTMFLRLSGCNLACVWCDTPYTWDWKRFDKTQEVHMMTTDEIIQEIITKRGSSAVQHLVISGGEPMLQHKNLIGFVDMLRSSSWYVEVETAGTIVPDENFMPNLFTVSLKLEHSGNPFHKRLSSFAVPKYVKHAESGFAVFKFVASSPDDFREIDTIVHVFKIPAHSVYIMPEGIKADRVQEVTQKIVESALARNYKLTTRLQILTYGNRRAV